MTAVKVLRYELRDLRRSRWLLGYVLLLLALTDALLRFGGGGPRAVLSLMNVVLVFVPLVSVVFGTMYLYGARDFIELLLAQPVGRGSLFAAARVSWVRGGEVGIQFYRELAPEEIESSLPATLLRNRR